MEDDDVMNCPACDNENGPMGGLGNLLHYFCRYCGCQYQSNP